MSFIEFAPDVKGKIARVWSQSDLEDNHRSLRARLPSYVRSSQTAPRHYLAPLHRRFTFLCPQTLAMAHSISQETSC